MDDQSKPAGNSLPAVLLTIIAALLGLGAVMVFSAGAGVDQRIDLREFYRYSSMRQVVLAPLAWLLILGVSHLDYRRLLVWRRRFWASPVVWLLLASVALLVLVLMPGIGVEINGARRWLKFGPPEYGLNFQPSELGKWAVLMFLAALAACRADRIASFGRGFVPACAALLAVVGLIGKEDFGTAALVAAVGVAVMLAGGVRFWHLLVLVPVAVLACYLLVYNNEYRWARIQAYLAGHGGGGDDLAAAYQAKQSIMAIGAGGLWGVGLGHGRIKLGWVPEDMTDFIFAVIGEELGFAGCVLVVALYVTLVVVSLLAARRAADRLGALLCVGIGGAIGAQAAMNLAVVTGLAPTKGIALPFVSAGGTGLVVTALATGVLVSVARRALPSAAAARQKEDRDHPAAPRRNKAAAS